jgi:SAM-dependent methyltransferase
MSNEEQIAYWNGEAGRKWADRDTQMAKTLAPIARDLMDHAAVDKAECVLDVGCGGGSETLMLASRLGPEACILGVDVSAPMLEVAEQHRAAAGDAARGVPFCAPTHRLTILAMRSSTCCSRALGSCSSTPHEKLLHICEKR